MQEVGGRMRAEERRGDKRELFLVTELPLVGLQHQGWRSWVTAG